MKLLLTIMVNLQVTASTKDGFVTIWEEYITTSIRCHSLGRLTVPKVVMSL
jgi:hypothetical protein